ncbi:MAG: hypothetical protein R3325_13965 [Thermoanaerobaculia bacterium]|nr:hypothetical protein [Thermoanaerobaculia bacterium]
MRTPLVIGLVALMGASPSPAEETVYLLDFEVRELIDEDPGLATELHGRIKERLRASPGVRISGFTRENWLAASSRASFGDHLTIEGRLEGSADHIAVRVTVQRFSGESGKPKTHEWSRPRIPRKATAIDRHFEKAAQWVSAAVLGEPFRKTVFTSCFKSKTTKDDVTVQLLETHLPGRVTDELRAHDLFSTHLLKSAKAHEVEAQCESVEPARLAPYADFVIYGAFWLDDRQLSAALFVERMERDDERALDPYSYSYEEFSFEMVAELARELSAHISRQWIEKKVEP